MDQRSNACITGNARLLQGAVLTAAQGLDPCPLHELTVVEVARLPACEIWKKLGHQAEMGVGFPQPCRSALLS
jgi:hypothetical protein